MCVCACVFACVMGIPGPYKTRNLKTTTTTATITTHFVFLFKFPYLKKLNKTHSHHLLCVMIDGNISLKLKNSSNLTNPKILGKKKNRFWNEKKTHKNTKSVGEQSSDLLWWLQDLLHGFVRILPAVLADGRIDPEELRRFPVCLLPSAGHQSGATDSLRRLARTSRRLVRTRQKRRPYVVSKPNHKQPKKKTP